MSDLLIRHMGGRNFQLIRRADGKAAGAVELPDPFQTALQESPDLNLMQELGWYLERYPAGFRALDTGRADRALRALRRWGEECFGALFDNRAGGEFLARAAGDGYENLRLRIVSDDPGVLFWPWEALRDAGAGADLGLACRVERGIDGVADPLVPPPDLPQDRINILLVTARPKSEGPDPGYRSVSKGLVDLVADEHLPVCIRLLRPPTLEALGECLAANRHFFHILHFDGHGIFGAPGPGGVFAPWRGPGSPPDAKGYLIFEDREGSAEIVEADRLAALLREHALPAVVLNACQSAMSAAGPDPFASTAAGLLRAGVRSVVAMSHSLLVSGAQVFLPEFYRELFRGGDVGEAVRRGRKAMFTRPERSSNPRRPLAMQDWLLPVVYQQEPMSFAFAGAGEAGEEKGPHLPEEALEPVPYGFVGRDGLLLELERAIRRPPGAVLLTGLAGVGKTTLARGFVGWLAGTGGLGEGCLWFRLTGDIRSAEFVLSRLGSQLGPDRLGPEFPRLDAAGKAKALAGFLREHKWLVVWDNFEEAAGLGEAGPPPALEAGELALLKSFVEMLQGGASKVLITSRGREEWLGRPNRVKVEVRGLRGEEREEYLDQVIRHQNLRVDPADPSIRALLDKLGGHPLAMRVVLPLLEDWSPAALLGKLDKNLTDLEMAADPEDRSFFAVLRLAEGCLLEEFRPLLPLLGLHERYVELRRLENMCLKAGEKWSGADLARFAGSLEGAGLLSLFDASTGSYEMHPALGAYMRATAKPEEVGKWARPFVEVMAELAFRFADRSPREQEPVFLLHWANLQRALEEAERLGMGGEEVILLYTLGQHAQNGSALGQAMAYYRRMDRIAKELGSKGFEATAWYQMGAVSLDAGVLAGAKEWLDRALGYYTEAGDGPGRSRCLHTLGNLAMEGGDLAGAEQRYQESLGALGPVIDARMLADNHHQLGILAHRRDDLAGASWHYAESLKYRKQLDDPAGLAGLTHQMGVLAFQQGDLQGADKFEILALNLFKTVGDLLGQARAWHQLGMIAQERGDYPQAEVWLTAALEVEERLNRKAEAATTCHQLGVVAWLRGDLASAEDWCLKSLRISEGNGFRITAALTYGQLGSIAARAGDWLKSGEWLVRAAANFRDMQMKRELQDAVYNLQVIMDQARPGEAACIKTVWAEAGFPDWDGLAEAARKTDAKEAPDGRSG